MISGSSQQNYVKSYFNFVYILWKSDNNLYFKKNFNTASGSGSSNANKCGSKLAILLANNEQKGWGKIQCCGSGTFCRIRIRIRIKSFRIRQIPGKSYLAIGNDLRRSAREVGFIITGPEVVATAGLITGHGHLKWGITVAINEIC